MNFRDYLKASAAEVNHELEDCFQKWSEEVEVVSPKLSVLNKAFIRACEGGKRLRGALVKFGYEMVRGKLDQMDEFDKEILKAAAAFEIFQTAILAHDDIIDKSPLRRGKPTLYQALGGDHYAISQTICLGDIGYFLAVRLLSESRFSAERKSEALRMFAQGMLETALGQMLDIELPHLAFHPGGGKLKRADALTVFRLKTARYTIVGPLKLGMVLGGAGEELLDQVERFGEALGIAFQIQDDILGIFGEEKALGKSVTSDIEEGKNTLLIIYARDHADEGQKKALERLYGKGKITAEELEEIRRIFKETGALEYSQKKAAQLVAQAKEEIEKVRAAEDKKQLLREMADFLVERNK